VSVYWAEGVVYRRHTGSEDEALAVQSAAKYSVTALV
jgi:hypothetical protein